MSTMSNFRSMLFLLSEEGIMRVVAARPIGEQIAAVEREIEMRKRERRELIGLNPHWSIVISSDDAIMRRYGFACIAEAVR